MVCRKCGYTSSEPKDFRQARGKPTPECRWCNARQTREWYWANRERALAYRRNNAERQRAYSRTWREKNKDRLREQARKRKRTESPEARTRRLARQREWNARRRAATRELILAAKDKPCVDCGKQYKSRFMHFDHVNGEKRFPVALGGTRSIELTKAEIAKCEVRCIYCHKRRHDNEKSIS